MSFAWPEALALGALVPLLVVAYWWSLRRRRKLAIPYASLALVRDAIPRRARWRRHLPIALLLAAMASLVGAAARPQATTTVPLSRTSIILALDVSRSMCATDVAPNRLTVAQDAARAFVEDHGEGTRIGIVAFAGFAELVVPPTTDATELRAAIDGFTTSFGTAIGTATLKSVDAIAEVNPEVEPIGALADVDEGADDPAAGDGFVPDIVVLLTDGAAFGGVDPILAARVAADRRVRVYTIGFGSDDPGGMVCTSRQLGTESFGGTGIFPGDFGAGGGFGDIRRFLVIDEETLRAIADITGGEYFRAEDADQLLGVFGELPTRVVLQTEESEISFAFAGLGALLAAAAVATSLAWHRHP